MQEFSLDRLILAERFAFKYSIIFLKVKMFGNRISIQKA